MRRFPECDVAKAAAVSDYRQPAFHEDDKKTGGG